MGLDSRRRKRVLVLTTTLPAKPGDGTPEFVLSLSKALSSEFEILIVAPRVPNAHRREKLEALTIRRFAYFPSRLEGIAHGAILGNLRMEPWRVVEVPFLVGCFLASAILAARKFRPDVVHAHWILPAGLVAVTLKRIFGTPFVVTAHGVDVHGMRRAPFPALKRLVLREASICSAASREMALMLGFSDEDADRLTVPMGVDVESIRSSVGRREAESGRFLFVGRLTEKKGAEIFVRAVARLPNAKAIVIGDGPESQFLSRLVKDFAIESRVELLGHRPRSRVLEELRRAHALVVPSKVARDGDADSTPLVMSEAMAAGVPVIASAIGGLSEQIVSGESGMLVEPDSPQSLARALSDVLEDRYDLSAWARAAEQELWRVDLQYTRAKYVEFLNSAARAHSS